MNDKNSSFGALFGKAKQWAKQELQNATNVTSTPQEHRRARIENQERLDQLERDADQARNDAIVEALLPQGVKDFRDRMETQRLSAEQERADQARIGRAERVTNAQVSMSGALAGAATGLAVETEPVTSSGGVVVTVEAVDPIEMSGGTFCGFTFEIPNSAADGTYVLVESDDFDAMQYSLNLVEDNDGWFFHPSYGPGSISVADGVANVALTFGSSGSETIQLRASVPLSR